MKEKRILNVGCGNDKYGTDFVDMYPREEVKRCDIENERLPFKDNEFDTVICCEVLEHVQNSMQVIKECMRVGKEAIIAVPNEFWVEMIPKNWIMPIPNYYAPTKKLLISAIHWLGGEITE